MSITTGEAFTDVDFDVASHAGLDLPRGGNDVSVRAADPAESEKSLPETTLPRWLMRQIKELEGTPVSERLRRNLPRAAGVPGWLRTQVNGGLRLPILRSRLRRPKGRSTRLTPPLAAELARLQRIGAIRRVSSDYPKHLVPVFPVFKPGKVRLIFDGRSLNRALQMSVRTTYEGVSHVMRNAPVGAFATKLDVSDAFLHTPLSPGLHRLCGFRIGGRTYCYCAMPFGLSAAPKVCQRALLAVLGPLRTSWEHTAGLTVYVDDICIWAASRERCREVTMQALQRLVECGFLPSLGKCELVPAQRVQLLGQELDFLRMRTSPVRRKVDTCARALRTLPSLGGRRLTRALQAVRGQLAWISVGAPLLRLFTRELQLVTRNSRPGTLRAAVRLALGALRSPELLAKQWPTPEQIRVRLACDASPTGWGVHVVRAPPGAWGTALRDAYGQWAPAEAHTHITVREGIALRHAVRLVLDVLPWRARPDNGRDERPPLFTAAEQRQSGMELIRRHRGGVALHVDSDATAAVAAGNCRGRSLAMLHAVRAVLVEAFQHGVFVSVSHIPGLQNTEADRLSRRKWASDYMLCGRVMAAVRSHSAAVLGAAPQVDCFAAVHSTACPQYFAGLPQPGAEPGNIWLQDWRALSERGVLFFNPPWTHIAGVVGKLLRERPRRFVLVVPAWENALWWHQLRLVTQCDSYWADVRIVEPRWGLYHRNRGGAGWTAMPPPRWALAVWYVRSVM